VNLLQKSNNDKIAAARSKAEGERAKPRPSQAPAAAEKEEGVKGTAIPAARVYSESLHVSRVSSFVVFCHLPSLSLSLCLFRAAMLTFFYQPTETYQQQLLPPLPQRRC
jgi:hypothetical protein